MRIPDGYSKRVTGPSKVKSRGAAAVASVTGVVVVAADSVEVSSRSVEVQRARSLALQAPEIRQALVDEIMGIINQGGYQVKGEDVVPVLIREHLADAGFGGSA